MASTPVETKPICRGSKDAPQAKTKTETEDTSVHRGARQIPQLSRKRRLSLSLSSSPHPHLSMTRFPHLYRLRSPLQYRPPHLQRPPSPRTSPSISQPRSSAPARLLHQLSTYLPYGADTLGIVGEYYWIARERGTIEAARNRASFPLRYAQAGERHEVTVRIRRNTTGGLGAAWTIDKVEEPEQ